jgi:hypothetical protein
VLGGIVLLASLALISSDWYIWVQFAVAILALIMCVFAVQGKAYWWLIGLVPVAIVFNPVWPLPIDDLWMRLASLASTVVFIAAGVTIKVPVGDEKGRPAGRYDARRANSRGGRGSGSARSRSKG